MDNSNQSPQPSQPPVAPPPQPAAIPPQPNQVPPAGPPNYQMPPKKGLSKGALWGIIGGAVGLLVIVIGIVLAVVLLGGPTQKDFQEAQAQAKAVATSYRDLESKFTAYTRGLTNQTSATTNGPDSVKEPLTVYKEDVAKLEGMKAFRDEETKKLYDAYVTRNEKFVGFIESYVASDDVMRDMGKKCSGDNMSGIGSDGSTLADKYRAAAAPCVKSLEAVSKSNNQMLSDYAKKLLPMYAEQQKLFDEMQAAYNAQNSSAYYSTLSKVRAQTSEFLGAAKELTEKAKEMEVSDQLNDLGKHLTDRANGKE